ncbi:MAG: CapA family protein [Treponema sp.]|jgi:poly-gamma-glutamate synthesis protein (capsule biosynthesis protein)|nr:CapA family protein [Treponema sp.]
MVRRIRLPFLLFFIPVCLFLFSCRETYDGIAVIPDETAGSLEKEQHWLEGILKEDELHAMGLTMEKGEEEPSIIIRLHRAWGKETEGIVLSRTWYLPAADPLEGRTTTETEACLAGDEDLVSLEDLVPPHVALRVDGLTVNDEAYPLVKTVSVSLEWRAEGKDRAQKRLFERVQERLQKLVRIEEKAAALTEFLRSAPKETPHEKPSLFWIASAGDLMLGRGAGEILLREGPSGIFGETAALLAEADLALLNLEGAVTGRGSRTEKAYNFRFDPHCASALAAAGIDAVLLANNHVFDYGEEGFLDSLAHLEKGGVGVLGAGSDINVAAAPFVMKAEAGMPEIRVYGIASYPRERSGWDGAAAAAGEGRPGILFSGRGGMEALKEKLSAGEENVLNIVLFHGGNEWTFAPDGRTREYYTGLAEAGADLVIGSHPHVVQGFEWVHNRPVFWSLGNFVFAGMDGTNGGEEGLFLRLGFYGKKLLYMEPVALKLKGPRTGVSGDLQNFYRLSKDLSK